MAVLVVMLNGTNENPWLRMGILQNPFPQVAKSELEAAMQQLASLDGEPLTGTDDIRQRLAGWSQEFIDLCVSRFVPGERVSFSVEYNRTATVAF